jgi:hypothetical protein
MPIPTQETANRIMQMLERRGQVGPRRRSGGGTGGRIPVLVICDSATAATGSGIGAQCYSATVLDINANDTAVEVGSEVWLTVLGSEGLPVVPTVDKVYFGLLAGEAVPDGTGTGRHRVYVGEIIPAKTTDYAVLSYGLAADPDDPPRWLSSPSVNTIVGRTSVVCGVPSEILGNLFFYNASNSYCFLIKAATFSETQTMTLPSAAPTSTGMVLKNGAVTSGAYSTGWDFVDAAEVTYTPAVSGDWSGSAPTTVQQALDRIAAVLSPVA